MTDRREIDAVFFDAGNTLFTERTSRAAIYAAALRRRGVEVAPDAMAAHMAFAIERLPREIDGRFRYTEWWFRSFIDTVLARAGFEGDYDAVANELIDAFRDPKTFRVFDDVRPAITRLKGAGFRLGVISNWSPTLPALLARLGFDQDFEVVVTSALARAEKPEAAIFRRAIEALRIEPGRCLHVGDHPRNDVAGARGAGMRAALLRREGSDAAPQVDPPGAEVIASLAALPRLAGLR